MVWNENIQIGKLPEKSNQSIMYWIILFNILDLAFQKI